MKLAVFDNRLLPQSRQQIQSLTTEPILFPDEKCPSEAELIKRTGDADIVLVGPWDKVTKSYLDACPSIKYVCLCGTSTTNIDLEELQKRGIPFNNVMHYGDEPMAEFTFMQLTMLLRGIGNLQWKQNVQHELMGKNIGIIGLGPLGQAIAHLALAYKMNVSYFSPHRKPKWEERGVRYAEMPALLAENEIIIACGPTNVQTLGKAEFDRIGPGGIVVQASAGNVLDRQAFLEWIAQDGNFAIFDKAAGEDNYNAYKDLPRVMFAPVVAGDTHETLARLGGKVYENVKNYMGAQS